MSDEQNERGILPIKPLCLRRKHHVLFLTANAPKNKNVGYHVSNKVSTMMSDTGLNQNLLLLKVGNDYKIQNNILVHQNHNPLKNKKATFYENRIQ